MKTLKDLEKSRLRESALIIGSGPSTKEYHKNIDNFIRKNNPFIIGINNVIDLIPIPEYHLFTNTQRFRTYGNDIMTESIILLGQNISLKIIKDIIGNSPYILINYIDKPDLPITYKNGKITGFFRTAGCLAIMIAHIMGASEINIVGMDGYTLYSKEELEKGQQSQHWYGIGHSDTADYETCIEKDRLINIALKNIKNYGINFNILTPTKYGEFYDSTRMFSS
jgi:hypothetical protein